MTESESRPDSLTRRRVLKAAILASVVPWGRPASAQVESASSTAGDTAGDIALWHLDAVELAERIRQREVSCVEVVRAHLGRIEGTNGAVGAITVVREQEVLKEAESVDRLLSQKAMVGPLHGVPMTVKENVDVAGLATTEGVAALRDNRVNADSPHVSQLRKAGAIVIGRTNMPDFGLRWHTDSGLWGATQNPWNPGLTPGGSSGGDAAAVAVGMAPLALGNDYGGSLRYPAQCCGIASIRPSRGRVPSFNASHEGHPPSLSMQLFGVQGPMARSVRDLRLALTHMSGFDARDPSWTPAPLRGPARPKRVALLRKPAGADTHPDIVAGVNKAARALQAAGYEVDDIEPPNLSEATQLWFQLVAADLHGLADGIQDLVSADAMTFLRHFLALHPASTVNSYSRALAHRHTLARRWSVFFETYSLILGPVSTQPPFAVGTDLASRQSAREMLESMGLVVAVNLLGLPAAVIPVDVAQGLPQAVQLIGPMFREDLCLDAAEIVEHSVGKWAPIDPVTTHADPEDS